MDSVAAPGTATAYSRGDHVHPTDTSRAAVSHTHIASQVTDFSEAVDDRVGALLQPGTNITLNYNDAANTLTVNSTASGSNAASGITFTPVGNLIATDVQAAIVELDNEKVAKAGDI